MYMEELPAQLKSQMKKPHVKEYVGKTLMQNVKGNIGFIAPDTNNLLTKNTPKKLCLFTVMRMMMTVMVTGRRRSMMMMAD